MPRPYHSPSSIKLAQRCRSAWARDYLLGLRAPRVTWDAIASKPNHPQRGPALGVAVHAVYEAWYTPGETPVWDDLPGQIALSGAHLLPHPSKCTVVHSEGPIGRELLPASAERDVHSPDRVLRVDGVPWGGFRDLLANAPEEWARLGVKHNDGWGLVDYKSTGSVDKWAVPPYVHEHGKLVGGLALDLQANVYAIDACELVGLDWIPGRWLYLETTAARRRAEPRDVRLELSRARDVVGVANLLARELDMLHDAYHSGSLEIERVPKNMGACNDYRGCHHHVSRGGGCNAKPQPIMRLRRNVTGGEIIMPLNPALVKKQVAAAAADTDAPPDGRMADAADAQAEAPEPTPVQTTIVAPANAGKRATTAKAAAPKAASRGMRLDLTQPFTLVFDEKKLSADADTLAKIVPALGASDYELSQGAFAVRADADSLAALLSLVLMPAA